jgi:hypothetical protein
MPAGFRQSRAVATEALSGGYGLPLHAVPDADASDVRLQPERWARLVGDIRSLEVSVIWATRAVRREFGRRRRFFDSMGGFGSARKLLIFTATGQP